MPKESTTVLLMIETKQTKHPMEFFLRSGLRNVLSSALYLFPFLLDGTLMKCLVLFTFWYPLLYSCFKFPCNILS